MSVGVTSQWTEFFSRENVSPVVYCEIYLDASNARQFLSGPLPGYSYPQSLSKFVPISRELDWKDHKSSVNKVVLTFLRDPVVEEMITTFPVLGASVDLYLCAVGMTLPAVNGARLFRGYAAEPVVFDDRVEIPVVSISEQLMQRRITGGWINAHPCEVISTALARAQLSSWMAADVFDFDNTDIPQWCVSRASVDDQPRGASAFSDPTPVDDVIHDLLVLMRAYLFPQEDGLLTLKFMKASTIADSVWTTDDITDLEVVSLYENMVNRVTVQSHFQAEQQMPANVAGGPQASWVVGLVREDTAAQNRFGLQYPGGGSFAALVKERLLQTAWANGHCRLQGAITAGSPGVGGTFVVEYSNPGPLAVEAGRSGEGQLEGMCGASWGSDWLAGGAQVAARQLTDAYTAFVMVGNEIIEVDRLTINARSAQDMAHLSFYTDPGDATPDGVFAFPMSATYRVKARGAQGTTAAGSGINTGVEDVTAQISMINADLAQFCNGGPIIKVRTSLKEYDRQIGEKVQIVYPRFKAYNRDGLTTAWTWFVIGKEVDVFGSSPGITWTLLFLSETSPPTPTFNFGRHIERASRGLVSAFHEQAGAASPEFAERYVASGLAVSATSGFGISVATGVACSGTLRQRNVAAVALNCRASRDSYIYWNFSASCPVISDVANGAAAPTMRAYWTALGKAVTNGSGVTGVTDLRVLKAFDGAKLRDSSVSTAQIGPAAVTAPKVADQVIDDQHVNQRRRVALNPNPNLLRYR